MPDQDFNCYNPQANPDNQTPPLNYKVWMCKWPGKLPKTFVGTWEITEFNPNDMCDINPNFPRGVQQVTWTRVTKDCQDQSWYIDLEPHDGYSTPFELSIMDPLVPHDLSSYEQAHQVMVSGGAYAFGNEITSMGCDETGYFMNTVWDQGGINGCKFKMNITGVTF